MALDAAQEAAVDGSDAWLPREWPNVDDELFRAQRILDDTSLIAAGAHKWVGCGRGGGAIHSVPLANPAATVVALKRNGRYPNC